METTLGQRIAERRKLLGLSQEGLGEKMGISRQAISKWEADAAVPEIDKLIALSKLFDVSVGWLLGTETQQDAQTNPGFTEDQLKMVEQIVRRYYKPVQAETPQKNGWRWLGYLCAGIAALIVIVTLMGISAEVQQHTHQITGVQSGYSSIQTALGLLSGRLDELAAGEKLLESFTFDAQPFSDWSGADVTFSAVPKNWREGDSAFLVVQLDEQEVHRAACSWDGSRCTAQVSLDAENGYEVCWLVLHADGTQEQQLLAGNDIQDLKENLSLLCTARTGSVSFSPKKLTVVNLHLSIKPPYFYGKEETVQCQSIEWVIYYNGKPIQRQSVTDPHLLSNGGSYSSNGTVEFPLPTPADGDTLRICVEVSLTNGLSASSDTGTWQYKNSHWKATA